MPDPAARDYYLDWAKVARGPLATYAGSPGDVPTIRGWPSSLVNSASATRTSQRSGRATTWWRRPTAAHASCAPASGCLTLAYETLSLRDDPDQVLVTYTPEDAATSERLALLHAWQRDLSTDSNAQESGRAGRAH